MQGTGREAVLSAYRELRVNHPELPSQLREFQVSFATFWRFYVAICGFTGRHTHNCTRCEGGGAPHVCLSHWIRQKYADASPWSPHAYRLMPKSWNFVIVWPQGQKSLLLVSDAEFDSRTLTSCASYYRLHSHYCGAPPHNWSSVGVGMWASRHICHGWKSGKIFQWNGQNIVPQLPQIAPKDLEAAMARRPKLLVCSVEYLADSQVGVDDPIWYQLFNFTKVRNAILKTRLAPAGTHPIVCIDEAQVSCLFVFQCWDGVLTNQS